MFKSQAEALKSHVGSTGSVIVVWAILTQLGHNQRARTDPGSEPC